jgi:hypothetical protein
MARRNESSLIEDLMKAPWWISAILAVISYLCLKFLVPSILQNSATCFGGFRFYGDNFGNSKRD